MMRETEMSGISRHKVFGGCRAETVDFLLQGAFLQKFPARIELAREGERPDFLHVVIDGLVEIYANSS